MVGLMRAGRTIGVREVKSMVCGEPEMAAVGNDVIGAVGRSLPVLPMRTGRSRGGMRKACERMDRMREETYRKHGLLDLAVPTIRASRDGEDE